MKVLLAADVFLWGELLALVVFAYLRRWSTIPSGHAIMQGAVFKGILERGVLYAGLLFGYPQVLIAFGALKLGTRLKEEQETPHLNAYFLIGNLISIFLAMIYGQVAQAILAAL